MWLKSPSESRFSVVTITLELPSRFRSHPAIKVVMVTGHYSEVGFEVVADNAIDLLAGTQAASAGMISANVRQVGNTLHADFGRVRQTMIDQAAQVSQVNRKGFQDLQQTVRSGADQIAAVDQQGFANLDEKMGGVEDTVGSVRNISALSVAVQAAGFALTARSINKVRGELQLLREDLSAKATELIEIHRLSKVYMESLVDYAKRTFETQERILETLVNSRTAEAKQLIRQGWDNLKGGFEEDAYVRFVKSLEYDNTVYFTHAELGRFYEKRGDLQKAEEHQRRAIAFAEIDGKSMKSFALVQYAGFLERQNRLPDCLNQLRLVVNSPPNGSTQGSDAKDSAGEEATNWRFYLAEMLVKSGDVPGGLAELKACINSDDRYFEAAMASDQLKAAQPRLTELLVEMDATRRAAAVNALAQSERNLKALAELDKAQHSELELQGRNVFEQILGSRFSKLAELRQAAKVFSDEVKGKIEASVAAQVGQLSNVFSSLKTHLANKPAETISLDETDMGKVSVGLFVLGVVLLVLVGMSPGNTAHPIAYLALILFLLGGLCMAIGNVDGQKGRIGELAHWEERHEELAASFDQKKSGLHKMLSSANRPTAISSITEALVAIDAMHLKPITEPKSSVV